MVKKLSYSELRSVAMGVAAETFWRMPARFSVARILGPSYSLRCLVFHNISSSGSPFTDGISVNTAAEEFEAALKFLTAYYTPVRLDEVLGSGDGRTLPERAVLVTFDDAYASVAELAAPLCRKLNVPAIFFVNAAFVNNQRLAPDNLVCYVANTLGMRIINEAARAVRDKDSSELHSLAEVFESFFPSLGLVEREAFLHALKQVARINEGHLAKQAGLYLSSKQLRVLAGDDFEIGNHTYTHVHCRALSRSDFEQEILGNQEELEALAGRKVRSFSVPYGSSKDLTNELKTCLEHSGHNIVFLSESVANNRGAERFRLDRVNPRTQSECTMFCDIEILPRLRAMRNRIGRLYN